MTNNGVLESIKVKEWIDSQKREGTKVRYKYFAEEYFSFVGKDPDGYFIEGYEFLKPEVKQKTAGNYKKDLQNFRSKLLNEPNKMGRMNKETSIGTTLRSVKSLFTFCEIDFPKAFWNRLIDFSNDRKSEAETPTVEQFRKILDNTDIQGKCIFLIMATSGSRIDSVLKLRRKDIDMEHEYPRIVFSYQYVKSGITKVKRVTPECKRFLESYFLLNPLTPEGKVFRMTRQNADYKWKCALKKAKLWKFDNNTGRCTMTTHCLKRFFKSNFDRGNKEWTDYFAEHRSDLDRRYRDYDADVIDEQYAKGVPYLLVYEKPVDVDLRIIQLQKQHRADEGKIDFLSKSLTEVRDTVQTYEERLKRVEKNATDFLKSDNPETNAKLDEISAEWDGVGGLPKEQIKGAIKMLLDSMNEEDRRDLIKLGMDGNIPGLAKKVKNIKRQ